MRERDRLHRRFLQTCDNHDWNHYKEYRNKVKNTLKNAAKMHASSEVQKHKNKPSSLWKTINQYVRGNKKKLQAYAKYQEVVADEFNQYLTSLGHIVPL